MEHIDEGDGLVLYQTTEGEWYSDGVDAAAAKEARANPPEPPLGHVHFHAFLRAVARKKGEPPPGAPENAFAVPNPRNKKAQWQWRVVRRPSSVCKQKGRCYQVKARL